MPRAKPLMWRVQSADDGGFDEIVVGYGKSLIIHAEMTDSRSCFVDVAGLCLWVHVGKNGRARIVDQEDRRDGPPWTKVKRTEHVKDEK